MGHVITDISKDTTTVRQHTGIPVVVEDRMRQLPKWSSKNDEQGRGHHKSIFVHGQVVMDAMQEEVQGDTNSVVREKSIDMEQEPMHDIFNQTPEEESQHPICHTSEHIRHTHHANHSTVGNTGQPQSRNDIPRGLAEGLQEVAKKRS